MTIDITIVAIGCILSFVAIIITSNNANNKGQKKLSTVKAPIIHSRLSEHFCPSCGQSTLPFIPIDGNSIRCPKCKHIFYNSAKEETIQKPQSKVIQVALIALSGVVFTAMCALLGTMLTNKVSVSGAWKTWFPPTADDIALATNGALYIDREQVYSVGQKYTFGKYPQESSDPTQLQDIQWIIIEVDKDNRRLLLLSEKILDHVLFDKRQMPLQTNIWRESNIRTWLNNTFYKTAFKDPETRNRLWHISNYIGNDLNSYVYLPSISDICKIWDKPYDVFQIERAAVATNYARSILSDSLYAFKTNLPDEERRINNENGYSPYILVDQRFDYTLSGLTAEYRRVAGIDPRGRIVTDNSSGEVSFGPGKGKELKRLFIVDDDYYGIRPMIMISY
ncbi:hypothetical protein FACS1894184_19920 [Clostridia bacterium]|nr:hypothetical protein FACS1894184_19920 [Clostridia bacterium]